MTTKFIYVFPFEDSRQLDASPPLDCLYRFFCASSKRIASGEFIGLFGIAINTKDVRFAISGNYGANNSPVSKHIGRLGKLFSEIVGIPLSSGKWFEHGELPENEEAKKPLVEYDYPFTVYPKAFKNSGTKSKNRKTVVKAKPPIPVILKAPPEKLNEDKFNALIQGTADTGEILKKVRAVANSDPNKVIYLLKVLPRHEWALNNDIAVAMCYSSECRNHVQKSCSSWGIPTFKEEVRTRVWEVFAVKIFADLDTPENFYKVHYKVVWIIARSMRQEVEKANSKNSPLLIFDREGVEEDREDDRRLLELGLITDSPEDYIIQTEGEETARRKAAELVLRLS